MSEFSSKSFNNAENPYISTSSTREHETGSSNSDKGSSELLSVTAPTSIPETAPNRKKRIVIASVAGLALVAGGVGTWLGINANAEAPAQPKEEHSVIDDPSEAASPSEEASEPTTTKIENSNGDPRVQGGDFERAEALPDFLVEANTATPDEFAALPKKTQIQWATWAGQYKPQFIDTFSQMEEDQGSYELTKDSDFKTLILDRNYNERIAANFGNNKPTTNLDNGKLDTDMATKYMMAFTVNDEKSDTAIDGYINSLNGESINVWSQAAGDAFDSVKSLEAAADFTASSSALNIDGEVIPGSVVDWHEADGTHFSFNIAAYETVDYKNQPITVTITQQAGL